MDHFAKLYRNKAEELAHKAFVRRKLSNSLAKRGSASQVLRDRVQRNATRAENELLDELWDKTKLHVSPLPTPACMEGNEEYAAWLESMDGRF